MVLGTNAQRSLCLQKCHVLILPEIIIFFLSPLNPSDVWIPLFSLCYSEQLNSTRATLMHISLIIRKVSATILLIFNPLDPFTKVTFKPFGQLPVHLHF